MADLTITRSEARALGAPGLARARPLNAPALLYLAQLAPGSRAAQAGALRECARFLGGADALALAWHKLAPVQLAALRSALAERYAPATANRMLCAVRGVLRACVTLRVLSRDECAELASVEKIRGSRPLRGRPLDPGELAALFAAIDETTPQGQRDAAILAVLYGCGLRRAELCALDVDDVSADGLAVLGKGNRSRVVPLPSTVRARLARWTFARGVLSGSRENRALFTHANGSGRLGPRGVYKRIGAFARLAKLAPLTPHDLRRSYVGDLLDHQVDLSTVQQLAGHSDPVVTARYDRRPARARALAVEVLTVPDVPTS